MPGLAAGPRLREVARSAPPGVTQWGGDAGPLKKRPEGESGRSTLNCFRFGRSYECQ